MSSNFLVAAFIPSLGFVALSMLVIGPILPPKLVNKIQGDSNQLLQGGLITLVIAIVIGFTLTSLNVYIYKFFEGYVVLNRIPFLVSSKRKKARRKLARAHLLRKQIKLLEKRVDKIGKNNDYDENNRPKRVTKLEKRIEELRAEFETVQEEYESTFPPKQNLILPTRFGNILRAAEAYPELRYKIAGVPLWTRIIKVVDKEYMAFIDATNDQCSFLLYCSVLSVLFSIMCIVISIYQFFLKQQLLMQKDHWLYFIPLSPDPIIYEQRTIIYLVIAGISFLLALFFYQASLWNVDQYGDMIRSTYDLYRFQLLKELRIQAPEDSDEEKMVWRSLCEFFAIGNAANELQKIYYYDEKTNGAG
jgi:hypothetical protein